MVWHGERGTDGQEITALDYFLDTQEKTTLWQQADEFRWILIASYFNDKNARGAKPQVSTGDGI